jgi:hypothetical protein
MNILPEPIIDNIYRYKHQLEFKHVMDELTDNNTDTMHLTRRAILRYLINHINEIEWVILNNNNRMSLCDYIKELSRRIFN